MELKNTRDNYGFIAKCFHWLTAVLFLGSYVSVYYRHWFTESKTPENWTALQLHLSIGVTVAVLVILRIIWRIMNRVPDSEPGSKLMHLVAHLGHFALYVMIVVMVFTGYVGTGVGTDYFFLYDIPKFADTQIFSYLVSDKLGMTFDEFEKPIDFIHKNILGKWLVWILILGHVGAALYHHIVKQDRTLQKMTSGKQRSSW